MPTHTITELLPYLHFSNLYVRYVMVHLITITHSKTGEINACVPKLHPYWYKCALLKLMSTFLSCFVIPFLFYFIFWKELYHASHGVPLIRLTANPTSHLCHHHTNL